MLDKDSIRNHDALREYVQGKRDEQSIQGFSPRRNEIKYPLDLEVGPC
jgi:hypothetical protein